LEDLSKKLPKVEYLKEKYSRMRTGIVAHNYFIDESAVGELRAMAFVFVCIDKGDAKKTIVKHLESWGTSFIDVGMGIQLAKESLLGTVTVTTSTPAKRDHFGERVALTDGAANNEYSLNVQIADLNALSATLAVIKWKKLRGYYADLEQEHFSLFNVATNKLMNEDRHAA
jgi:hypothetical protein